MEVEDLEVTTSDDDFDEEVEAASQSRELEKAKGGYSLEEVKTRLGLD